MKYKVGDKVKVKRDLEVNKSYGVNLFVAGMNAFKGRICTISDANNYGVYELKENDSVVKFKFTDEMFEPIEQWELVLSELSANVDVEPLPIIVKVSHVDYKLKQNNKTFYFLTYDDVTKGDYVYCDTCNGLMVCVVKEVYITLEQLLELKDLPNLQLLKKCRTKLEE